MTDLTDRRSDVGQWPEPPEPAVGDADLALLLERSAAGDEQAFAALYDTTSRLCFGLAMRIVHDETTAEQVTRDAYLHLWTHSERYDPSEGSALAWIIRLVHRRAVECARLRRPTVLPQGGDEATYACHVGPEGEARECLELAYFEGRTWCEVAREEHIEPVAAAVRIRDGLLEM